MGIQSSLTETKRTTFRCDLIRNERVEVIAHIANAIASGCWCGPEMWKGLFIFVKRHFNCIVKPQYVRVSCFQVHWDCIKGGGGIHGKEGRMPVTQATGLEPGPALHMATSQLSSPLSLKPWMMNRVFLSVWKLDASIVDGSEERRICDKHRRFHVFAAQPLWPVSICPISACSNATTFQSLAKSHLFQEAQPDLSLPHLLKRGIITSTRSGLWLMVCLP